VGNVDLHDLGGVERIGFRLRLFFSGLVGDPVCFPGFSAVGRKRLFEVGPALLQALEMEFPGADGVVEIVLAVARVGDDLLRVDCCVMVAEALDREKKEADEENAGEQGFMRSH
jgi:hypothetical protein